MSEPSTRLPPPSRTITAQEAIALVEAHAPDLHPRFLSEEYRNAADEHVVLLYEGGLTVHGNFAVEDDSVLVLGDLTVHGLVSDCRHADHTLLVVTGTLRARNAFFSGALEVGGDLTVDELLYVNSLNDYRTVVGGDVRARVLLEEGMVTVVGGRIEARVLSTMNAVRQGKPPMTFPHVEDEELDRWLIPDVLPAARFDERGRDGLYARLTRGERVLRE